MPTVAEGGHAGAHAAQMLCVTLWSGMIVAHKALIDSWSPWHVIAIQFAAGAELAWLLLLVWRGWPGRGLGYGRMLLFGMIAPGGAMLLSILGTARTDVVSVAVIWGLTPLMVPLAGRLFLNEPLRPLANGGALLGFGLVLWLVSGRQSAGMGDLAGNLLVFGATLCTTGSQTLGRAINRRSQAPIPVVATLQVSGAAAVAVPAALLFGPPAVAAPALTGEGRESSLT